MFNTEDAARAFINAERDMRMQPPGVITDSMCSLGDHSRMKMGSNDAECTLACVDAHGATFVLWDGKETYTLSDQKTPEKFAGKRVTVSGTLSGKSDIKVDSMVAAK